MDVSAITKDYTRLQKKALNNFFDTLTLFQDHVDRTTRYLAYNMGLNGHAKAVSDQYNALQQKGLDDARKLIDQSLDNMEGYFSGLQSTQDE